MVSTTAGFGIREPTSPQGWSNFNEMRFQETAILAAVLIGSASATVTFERRWQWYQETVGRSVELGPDGGYLVSGGTWIEGSRYGIVLLRVDSLGDTTWVRHIPDTDPDGGFACGLPDGGSVVLGTVNSRYIFTSKYDRNGDSVWSHVSETRGLVSAVIATQDSGCLAVGRLPDALADFGAIKLAPDGHEEWVRYYEEPRVFESWARGVSRTREGGYVLCGDCTDYMDSYVRIVLTDSAGTERASWLYSGPVGPVLRDVRQTADNRYFAVGAEFDTLGYREVLYVMLTDSAGNIVSTKSFAPDGASTEARAMTKTRDGGYTVAGEIRWRDSTRVWLVKLDESGDTLWTSVLGGPEDETAYDVEQTGDLGFIIAGASSADGGSLLLVKTDSLGRAMTGIEETGRLGIADFGLRIAPNPAGKSRLAVRYHLPVAGRARIELLDVAGRSVAGRPVRVGRRGVVSLDVSGLADGVYLVRLDASGFRATHKIVVMRH
ncbi:MAG: T9SS type A sorting domain-containing protein [candidate division WOR-3 bacterium]|nr:MAG: T9SS type A sorting domain-containing protein [candidate division WOR-3 bacterium]